MSAIRFGFVTCVQLGLSCMEAIYEVGGRLDLVVTLEDDQAVSKVGRVYPDAFCARNQIPLVKSRNINAAEVVDAVRAAAIDWLFVIGWSQIARAEILAAPTQGALGMHPSLLPVGRGRAAIPWAILKRLNQTGVTLFKLSDGVDTGDVVAQEVIPINSTTDAGLLYQAVDTAHVRLMKRAFPELTAGRLRAVEQDESLATYWPKRAEEDGLIDLAGSVHDAERLVRAVTRPYPGAFFLDDQGRKVIVWKAKLAEEMIGTDPEPHITFCDGALALIDWERDGSPSTSSGL